jgi:hypothetical protein
MAHREEKPTGYGAQKPSATRRTVNPPQGGKLPDTQNIASDKAHDAKGRQGGFEGAGRHARTGNRGHQ